MRTRILFLLAVILTTSITFGFAGGDGTEADPYQIATFEDINSVNNDLSAHYIMVNDIDLTGMEFDSFIIGQEGPYFSSHSELKFSGSFDGNNHKIIGLRFKSNNPAALFKQIQYGTVSNLIIEDCYLESKYLIPLNLDTYSSFNKEVKNSVIVVEPPLQSFRLILGSSMIALYVQDSIISNCSINGKITDSEKAAGIVFTSENSTITNCSFTGEISDSNMAAGIFFDGTNNIVSSCSVNAAITNNNEAAGAIYVSSDTIITDCNFTGDFDGNGSSSGIILNLNEDEYSDNIKNTISNCSFTGTITNTNSAAGIANWVEKCSIINCNVEGDIDSIFAGGIVSGTALDCSIKNCSFEGEISSCYSAGGIALDIINTTISNCSFKGSIFEYSPGKQADNNTKKMQLPMTNYYGGIIGRCQGTTTITGCSLNGKINGSTQYIAGIIAHVQADNDETISIKGCQVEAEIINRAKSSSYGTGGITCNLNRGTIQDCIVDVNIITSGSYTGGITGTSSGKINNCKVNAKITSKASKVGGIAGAFYGSISNCIAVVDIEGGYQVGGIAGYYSTSNDFESINNCSVYGTIESQSEEVGGIAGNAHGPILNCKSFTDISTESDWAGGISGVQCRAVSNCTFEGTINAGEYVGGISGTSIASITECHAKADINGESIIGGIAGEMRWDTSKIENCSWDGTIYAECNFLAGIVCELTDGKVINSYSVGSLFMFGETKTDMLVSYYQDAEIINSYYIDTNAIKLNDQGTALTEDQLKIKANFIDWDFDNVWRMCQDNVSYPHLRWILKSKGDLTCPFGVDAKDFRIITDSWLCSEIPGPQTPNGDDNIFNKPPRVFDPNADMNEDGSVDILDYCIFAENWGK